MTRPRTTRSFAAVVAAVSLALVGCAATSPTASGGDLSNGGDDTGYPVAIDNCGEEVVFEAAPERVILLETAPVTILDGIGVLDRVIARAGVFSPAYYDTDLNAAIDRIPMLSDDLDAAGHLAINAEAVIAQQPDLVLGLPDGLTREGLLDAGANTLIQPVYCPGGNSEVSFESLYDQILVYGQIFDRSAQAQQLVVDLQKRVSAVVEQTAGSPPRTAAVLYPSVGGGPVYAYGSASMAQPQLEAAGFVNVFADSSERVFEVSIEELLGRDPDVLVLLYQGDEAGVQDAVASLPGSEALTALQNNDVLVQLFNFTEPPTPLSVTGLEHIVARFGTGS